MLTYSEFLLSLGDTYYLSYGKAMVLKLQFINTIKKGIHIKNITPSIKKLFDMECELLYNLPHNLSDALYSMDTVPNIMPAIAYSAAAYLKSLKDYKPQELDIVSISNTAVFIHYASTKIRDDITKYINENPISTELATREDFFSLNEYVKLLNNVLIPGHKNKFSIKMELIEHSKKLMQLLALKTLSMIDKFEKYYYTECIQDTIARYSYNITNNNITSNSEVLLNNLKAALTHINSNNNEINISELTEYTRQLIYLSLNKYMSKTDYGTAMEKLTYTYHRGSNHFIATPALFPFVNMQPDSIILAQLGILADTNITHSEILDNISLNISNIMKLIKSNITYCENISSEMKDSINVIYKYPLTGISQILALEFLDSMTEKYNIDIMKYIIKLNIIPYFTFMPNSLHPAQDCYMLNYETIQKNIKHIHVHFILHSEVGLKLKSFENPIVRGITTALCSYFNNNTYASLLDNINNFHMPHGFAYSIHQEANALNNASSWINTISCNYEKEYLLTDWFRHIRYTDTPLLLNQEYDDKYKLFAIISILYLVNYPYVRNVDNLPTQTLNIIIFAISYAINTFLTAISCNDINIKKDLLNNLYTAIKQ